MAIQLLPMKLEHVPAIATLERECFSSPWSAASIADELKNPLAVLRTAMDSETQKLAGYAGLHHIIDEGHITNIAVAEKWRRRGVGALLLRGLLDYAGQNRLRLLTLEVRPSNEAALALYEAFGFERVGLRKNYYRGPVEDALILTLELENGVL